MKSAGLNSTYRNMLKRSKKITATETYQAGFLAAKEKQKLLRLQAARAQFERQKKEKQNEISNVAHTHSNFGSSQ